jgi:hypothetical protein
MEMYNKKIGELELRTVDSLLMRSGDITTAEIVRWVKRNDDKPFCYTVVYWLKDSEGYYAHFVGDRFLECNYSNLLELLTRGQILLNSEQKAQECDASKVQETNKS